MKTLLAVLAHEGAAPTIVDFQPQWEKLGLPIFAFLPKGHRWPGAPVERIFNLGANDRRHAICARFLGACETLLSFHEFDAFAIIEYDTLNLADHLPDIRPDCLNCGLLGGQDVEGIPRNGYPLAFSPWIATRPLLAAFIEAMHMQFRRPTHEAWTLGFLDRWLGVVLNEGMIPIASLPNCDPCIFAIYRRQLPRSELKIVHGFKSRHEFGDLWPKKF